MHKTWKIVKRDLGWDGGTIHQVADEVSCSVALLLADKGDRVEVRIGNQWSPGTLISLDGFPMDEEGDRWAKFTAHVPGFNSIFTAHVPGFNNDGTLTGLRGDHSIRKAL